MEESKSYTLNNEEECEEVDGREVRPPLIPSNFEKIQKSEGSYNLRGFYNDLFTRLSVQNEAIKRVEANCQKFMNNVTQASRTHFSIRNN